MEVIKELGEELPIMGVCMGLQCMAQVFGGEDPFLLLSQGTEGNIIRAPCGVMHGKSSEIYHNGEGLLKDLPK